MLSRPALPQQTNNTRGLYQTIGAKAGSRAHQALLFVGEGAVGLANCTAISGASSLRTPHSWAAGTAAAVVFALRGGWAGLPIQGATHGRGSAAAGGAVGCWDAAANQRQHNGAVAAAVAGRVPRAAATLGVGKAGCIQLQALQQVGVGGRGSRSTAAAKVETQAVQALQSRR